jgi:REP element-mobilizing transposase RayT
LGIGLLLSVEKLSFAPPLLIVPIFHRRRLPHVDLVNRPLFLTWRLHGSLPRNRYFTETMTSGQAFAAMDRVLDQGRSGPLYLRRDDITTLLVDAICYREQHMQHFELHSYVVMANHVHVLITPRVEVSNLMQSLKRYTARKANQILGLTGRPFWQEESYDHVVRDGEEFRRIAGYIEMNPVRAGLVTTPEEFCWSSAYDPG